APPLPAPPTLACSPFPYTTLFRSGSGLGNYTITYVDGSLTVGAKAATVTADSTSKTYGQTVTFAGSEFAPSGFINGDTVTSVTQTGTGDAWTAATSPTRTRSPAAI